MKQVNPHRVLKQWDFADLVKIVMILATSSRLTLAWSISNAFISKSVFFRQVKLSTQAEIGSEVQLHWVIIRFNQRYIR
jgi:hypothetical protein